MTDQGRITQISTEASYRPDREHPFVPLTRHLMPLRKDASTVRLTHRECPTPISCGPDLTCTTQTNDTVDESSGGETRFLKKRRVFSSWLQLGLSRGHADQEAESSDGIAAQPFGNLTSGICALVRGPSNRQFSS